MAKPTFEQFVSAQQTATKKSKSWWTFTRKKLDPAEKRRRKFEGDTRPYSEKNKGHYKTATVMSYVAQAFSVMGAVYGAYRMFFDNGPLGIAIFVLALFVLYKYEELARWTSDKFWDEWVAGRFNLKFAALNFGVIWSTGFALTLGGAFFLLNDVQPSADGSISIDDPAYRKMEKQVSDARSDLRKAEKRVAAFKTDGSNLCPDQNGKMVVCYGERRRALGKLEGVIVGAEARLTSATNQMASRFEGIKILDDRATRYHLQVVDSRFWVQIGLFSFMLVLFEFCMRYRSVYQLHQYWEDCYARAYGCKPETEGKGAPKAKKPSPRPSGNGQVGVTRNGSSPTRNRPSPTRNDRMPTRNGPSPTRNEPVTAASVTLPPPVELDPGERMCALNGCTEPVSGKKLFCTDSHRVQSYSKGRVAT